MNVFAFEETKGSRELFYGSVRICDSNLLDIWRFRVERRVALSNIDADNDLGPVGQ